MLRLAKFKRMISSILAEVQGLGGATQNRLVSPKGLYSRPKKGDALVIPLGGGRSRDVILALQDEIDLGEGDTYLTDDKSFVHFQYADGNIKIKTQNLDIELKDFTLDSENITLRASSKVNVECDAIELGGSAKQLVTYAELESAIKAELAVIAAHTHEVPVAPGPTTPSLALQAETFNMAAAKTAKVSTG